MGFETFINRSFAPKTMAVIEKANEIVAEYQAMGFSLTLRQLYYQFVARALLENKQSEYKRLGSIINDARLAGLVDWSAIEDRTRNVRNAATWDSPEEILDAVGQQYQEDPWETQTYAPEVWIEKDALIGVIEPICRRMRVPHFACRGNVSQSEVYAAGKRFEKAIDEGKTPIVLHLGDHDPNGIDMTRDNRDRLTMFARSNIQVRRLALNMSQIEQYNPPANPAKETDSRFASYVEEYGEESWELDALDPPVIEGLIQAALDEIIDQDEWQAVMDAEERNKQLLGDAASRWHELTSWLENGE